MEGAGGSTDRAGSALRRCPGDTGRCSPGGEGYRWTRGRRGEGDCVGHRTRRPSPSTAPPSIPTHTCSWIRHTHTQIHMRTHTHTHTHTHKHKYTCAHTQIHTLTHTHTHIQMYTHAQMRTNTHTNKHTQGE